MVILELREAVAVGQGLSLRGLHLGLQLDHLLLLHNPLPPMARTQLRHLVGSGLRLLLLLDSRYRSYKVLEP